MVGSGSVHFAAGTAAPEVSAADNNGNLYPHIRTFLNACAHLKHLVKINSHALFTGKHLAAEL